MESTAVPNIDYCCNCCYYDCYYSHYSYCYYRILLQARPDRLGVPAQRERA